MKCQSCGFENQKGQKFCGECGVGLETAVSPTSQQPKAKNNRRILIGLAAIAAVFICICALVSVPIRGSDDSTNSATEGSRCVNASSSHVDFIRTGVQAEISSNTIRTARAVEIDGGFIVAAKIYGPGIEDGAGPGVWYIDGSADNPGRISSMNGTAKAFTPFPDAFIGMSADGAREAERCAD